MKYHHNIILGHIFSKLKPNRKCNVYCRRLYVTQVNRDRGRIKIRYVLFTAVWQNGDLQLDLRSLHVNWALLFLFVREIVLKMAKQATVFLVLSIMTLGSYVDGSFDPFMDQTMFTIDWKGPILEPIVSRLLLSLTDLSNRYWSISESPYCKYNYLIDNV